MFDSKKIQQTTEKLLNIINRKEQTITIPVLRPSLIDRLLRRDARTFILRDMSLAQVAQFLAIVESVDYEEFVKLIKSSNSDVELLKKAKYFIDKYKDVILKAIAVALETSDVAWLERNLTADDLFRLYSLVFERLNLDDFFGILGLLASVKEKQQVHESNSDSMRS